MIMNMEHYRTDAVTFSTIQLGSVNIVGTFGTNNETSASIVSGASLLSSFCYSGGTIANFTINSCNVVANGVTE